MNQCFGLVEDGLVAKAQPTAPASIQVDALQRWTQIPTQVKQKSALKGFLTGLFSFKEFHFDEPTHPILLSFRAVLEVNFNLIPLAFFNTRDWRGGGSNGSFKMGPGMALVFLLFSLFCCCCFSFCLFVYWISDFISRRLLGKDKTIPRNRDLLRYFCVLEVLQDSKIK